MARREPNDSLRLPRDVVATARIVAGYTGESMGEICGAILRPVLAEMERREAERRSITRSDPLPRSEVE